MKIRALDAIGDIKKGDTLNAIKHPFRDEYCVYDSKGCTWYFTLSYDITVKTKCEVVEEENQEIVDRVEKAEEDFDNLTKVYGNKYTLSELKELKELFK